MKWLPIKKKRIIIYYLSLILTMVIMAFMSYWIIGQTMYTKIVEQYHQKLINETKHLNDRVEGLSGNADRLYYFTDSIWLRGKEHIDKREYVRLTEYRKFLDMTSLEDDWVENYYVYFPQSGVVFDKSRIYMSWDEVYGVFSNIEEMDKDTFFKEIVWSESGFLPSCNYISDGKASLVIPYVKKLAGVSDSIVIMMLNTEKLLNFPGDNLSYEISDQNQVLYDAGMSEALKSNYKKYSEKPFFTNIVGNNVLLEAELQGCSIRVRLMLTSDLIQEIMNSVVTGIFLVFVIIALIGIGILFGVDKIFNKPYRGMSQKYQERENTVRTYYANRLLETASSDTELDNAREFLNIDEKQKSFVCIIRNPDRNDVSEQLNRVRNTIQMRYPQSVFVSRKKWEMVCVFYNQKNLESLLQMLTECVAYEKESELLLAIGDSYENLRGISVSYMEARTVLEYRKTYPTSECNYYRQLPAVASMVTLGIETRNKLQVLIASKEIEKAKILFCKVFEETCQNEYTINPVAANNFIAQIAGILIFNIEKLIYDKQIREELLIEVSRLFSYESSNDFKSNVVGLIEKIGNLLPDLKKKDQAEIQKILRYIDNNYMDPDISLGSVGECFHMNVGYFSQYFKQHTNKNFSQYLEGIRITRAMELLVETEKTISEIMGLVGYSNRNTFYKAFMRVNGVSPTVYRESVLHDKK